MDQKIDRLYPSAPLGKNDIDQRLEKKLKDVNSFNYHINNIKELITYFKDENNKSKKRYGKCKTLTTILKSFDTFVANAITSSSITFSLTGIGLIVVPISTVTTWGFSVGKKVIYEIIRNNYKKYKKQYEKDQQSIKSFDR